MTSDEDRHGEAIAGQQLVHVVAHAGRKHVDARRGFNGEMIPARVELKGASLETRDCRRWLAVETVKLTMMRKLACTRARH
jgi:hypothetical protein